MSAIDQLIYEVQEKEMVIDEMRQALQETVSMLISLQNAGHSGDADKVLRIFHRAKYVLNKYPKAVKARK
jgi:hypothetical protein